MEDNSLLEIANAIPEFQLELKSGGYSYDEFKQMLSAKINFLINSNFSKLVGILYRLDISEKKLKELLAETLDTPASDVIATMIIERQMQKIESRKKFRHDGEISDDEKW
jgi:hypothetical protein